MCSSKVFIHYSKILTGIVFQMEGVVIPGIEATGGDGGFFILRETGEVQVIRAAIMYHHQFPNNTC